jgi:putative transposase
MARIARVVVPNLPHHVTQRGNRRQKTFFEKSDYQLYLDLLAAGCVRARAEIWAYCLMPNHVHLLVVPSTTDGLRAAIADTHRRYTRHVNFRKGWRGHLWQERFASFPVDKEHLLTAAQYIELNPVRARLVKKPGAYRWSSAKAHLRGKDDPMMRTQALLEIIPDWRDVLSASLDRDTAERIRAHERTGRPLGHDGFVTKLERRLKRALRSQKRGPKPKGKSRS